MKLPVLSTVVRESVWRHQGVAGRAAWLALQPAAGLFATGVALRDLAYRVGVLRAQRAGVPVVSVGNLSVGGTGKTPLTLWLANELRARGRRVAIVLRGYAGSARNVTIVSRGTGPESDVETVGDEAIMLAKSFAGTVITARRRIDAARAAAELGCDLVVLDDGFQHRALGRDFDLVLVGSQNGALLPAGPMREGWRALRRADAVLLVSKPGHAPAPAAVVPRAIPTFGVRFVASTLVSASSGCWSEVPLARLSGARVALVCGIAEPGPFYAGVREWEANATAVFEFADHHQYTTEDWQRINRAARDAELVVTTEKDLVKLEHFPFARDQLVAVRIAPRVEDAELLLQMIERRIERASERTSYLEGESNADQ